MLSQLLRFHVTDAHGRRARLVDVAIAGPDQDYPPVDRLLVRGAHGLRLLPWSAITGFDRRVRLAQVADLEAGQSVSAGEWPAGVWLGRDVLDGIIINIWRRHVTVANDLWLAGNSRGLRLRAAATGPRAILPRLTGRFYSLHARRTLYDWKYIEFLRGDPLRTETRTAEHWRIARLPAGEIAHLAGPLPYLHAAELVGRLPEALAADTLEEMPLDRQVQIFEELSDARARAVLALMAPEVAADLLGRLDPDLARRFLNRLPRPQSERLIELLRYPTNTVGGAMTNDIVRVPAGLTVGQARQALRQQLTEPGFVHFLYVVDDEQHNRLRGVLSLRGLVVAEAEQVIGELMNRDLLKLAPLEAARPAAFRMLESGLAALPVVGGDGRLLGALTVDAAMRLVAPRSWRAQVPRVFS